MDDPILDALFARAAVDPECAGLILSGSRAAGAADAASDYDLFWVLHDGAYDRCEAQNRWPEPAAGLNAPIDLGFACPRDLADPAKTVDWMRPAWADAIALLDKTGVVTAALESLARLPAEQAHARAAAHFDGYLNAFYRSLKAWRRDNPLGGQLQAAESALHLVTTLYALERRWAPYHDRLARRLHQLAGQGWEDGYLAETLRALVQTGDPRLQQALYDRVSNLLRTRGHGGVIDAWGGEIERVRAWEFTGRAET